MSAAEVIRDLDVAGADTRGVSSHAGEHFDKSEMNTLATPIEQFNQITIGKQLK